MNKIKRLRHALGLTQLQLSKKLDISLATMNKYEKHGVHSDKIKDKIALLARENKLFHLLDEDEIDIKSAVKQILVSIESMKYTIDLMRKEIF